MRCVQVIERVLPGSVHHVPWMQTVRPAEYHVENHGYAFGMAFVNKLLVILRCAVCLVYGKIEIGIIAPGNVAVEFVDRKEPPRRLCRVTSDKESLLAALAYGAVLPSAFPSVPVKSRSSIS